MTHAALLELCLGWAGAYADKPFRDDRITTVRFGRKIFAFIFDWPDQLFVNLKCEPMQAEFWRKVYPAQVTPGYHMNKAHWNSVLVNSGLDRALLLEMVGHSYRLVGGKLA